MRTSLTDIEAKKIEALARYFAKEFGEYIRRQLAAYCLALEKPVTADDLIVVSARYTLGGIGLTGIENAALLEELGVRTDESIWAEVNK